MRSARRRRRAHTQDPELTVQVVSEKSKTSGRYTAEYNRALCTPRVADRSNRDDRRTDWMVCSGSSFL